VGKLVAFFAQLCNGAAPCRQRLVRPLVRRLSISDRLMDTLDLFLCGSCFGRGGLSRALGLDPAGVEELRFDRADLVRELAVSLGSARLPSKLSQSLFLLREDFAKANKVGFRGPQLLLGILAPGVQPGNACRLLEEQPALDGFGRDDRADLALADERRRMSTGRCVCEQQGDVLGANVTPVDPVGRAGASLDAPGDLAFARNPFITGFALDEDGDFGKVARWPRGGSGEDHVVHPAAAQRLWAGFAHRPADRF
jgi:hypothetical protein